MCVELFAGSFGWSAGWLELGGYAVGFDIDHQPYHGPVPSGADLVIQDVCTLHGSQFKDAHLILASSPCPEFSYMAMPWARSKQIGEALRGNGDFPDGYTGSRTIEELTMLFRQPARIQLEAIEAAGRFIPMIQENVRGAQPWVGRAAWHYGSYYLWGDVPALMPNVMKAVKVGGLDWSKFGQPGYKGEAFNTHAERAMKNASGGSWFAQGPRGELGALNNARDRLVAAGVKQHGSGPVWFDTGIASHGSQSSARKAASAKIARIPAALSAHIAHTFYPAETR